MKNKALLLTLLLTIFVLVSAISSAAKGPKKKPVPASKITDAAGRTHVRPMPRISEAQRKAAAQRRKNLRAQRNVRTVVPKPGTVR